MQSYTTMTKATEISVKSWFDRQYARKKQKSMRSEDAYPVFLDYLKVKPGEKLLDIGCGPGWLLKAAARKGMGTWGVDLSPHAIELSRQASPDSQVQVSSVTNLQFPDKTFDYVTSIGVLEHFIEMEKSIREMQRVAKDDARFCIMVPNSRTVHWKISRAFSRQNRESNENALSLAEWKNLFLSNGFAIEQIYRDEWQIRKMLKVIGLGKFHGLFAATRNVIWTLIPLQFAHQFVFILKKSA